jgi:hypothetical protein
MDMPEGAMLSNLKIQLTRRTFISGWVNYYEMLKARSFGDKQVEKE